MSQIVYSHQKINHETGEVTESKFVKKEVKSTDEFIFLYIKHIGTLAKLPSCELKTLICLSSHINWETGDIGLSPNIVDEVQNCSELTISSIRSAISRLAKKNFLQKVKNNWYRINPDIFWRGSEIKRQKMFELTYQWEIKE
jgi:hypothetical protein